MAVALAALLPPAAPPAAEEWHAAASAAGPVHVLCSQSYRSRINVQADCVRVMHVCCWGRL